MAKSVDTATRGSEPWLADHFDSWKQQFESAKLGMSYFLAAEIMLFSVLFCLYAVYRNTYPEVIASGRETLDVTLGALGAVALLLSSLTVALALRAAQRDRQRSVVLYLASTLVFACVFVGVQSVEYRDHARAGRSWGERFYEVPESARTQLEGGERAVQPPDQGGAAEGGEPLSAGGSPANDTGTETTPRWVGPSAAAAPAGMASQAAEVVVEAPPVHHLLDPDLPENAHVFFTIYFAMTGIHGLHVLIAMLVLSVMLSQAVMGWYSSRNHIPVHLFGQFWHFLVIVWLFLFPLIYLV